MGTRGGTGLKFLVVLFVVQWCVACLPALGETMACAVGAGWSSCPTDPGEPEHPDGPVGVEVADQESIQDCDLGYCRARHIDQANGTAGSVAAGPMVDFLGHWAQWTRGPPGSPRRPGAGLIPPGAFTAPVKDGGLMTV